MKRRNLLVIFVVSVALAVVAGAVLSAFMIDDLLSHHSPIEIPPDLHPAVLLGMTLKTIVTFVNMALLLLLLGIYVDLYRHLKSNFTAGLVLLILVLLMNALTSNPLLFFRIGNPIMGFGGGFIIPDLFTTFALIVLFYLSLE
jgi:MFS family permease